MQMRKPLLMTAHSGLGELQSTQYAFCGSFSLNISNGVLFILFVVFVVFVFVFVFVFNLFVVVVFVVVVVDNDDVNDDVVDKGNS